VKNQNVKNQNVKNQNVKNQNVKNQNVKNQNVKNQIACSPPSLNRLSDNSILGKKMTKRTYLRPLN